MELDFGQAQSKESIIDFVNSIKKQTKVKPNTEITGGNSIVARIKNIVALTQERLGKYKDDYILIQDKDTLHSYIDKAVLNGVIAIDTETTGLNPISDNLVGVCIYTPGMKSAYIPINHIGYVSEARLSNQLAEADVAEELKRCLKIKSIFFNAKFDIRVMKNHLGLVFEPAWDGFIAAKALNELEEEGNLKYLHKKYCGNIEDTHYTFEKMFKGLNFALVPPDTAYLYAAHDAVITYELYKYQERLLDKNDDLCKQNGYEKLAFVYHEIELPLVSVVAEMEENGISLDKEFAKQLSEKYSLKLKEIENKFFEECKHFQKSITEYRNTHKNCKLSNPININSPAQIAILLYDILNYKSVSKKDPRGTGESILAEFKTPLTEIVLEYREVAKLLSTYIDKLPNEINPKTGRVHASFNQMGAACVSGETLIPTANGVFRIDELLKDVCCDSGVYYPYKIQIINRYGEWEETSYAVMFKDAETVTLVFEDGTHITGTYHHPILVNDIFVHLDNIQIGDFVDSHAEGLLALKVVDKYYGKADVYDFTVPKTHSFVSNLVISHNTGRFSCLPAGTMINLVGEQKPIEDVKVGDLVYCYDDDGNLRIRRVTRTWDIGERPCLDIKWQSSGNGRIGHLICTENHQIKTKSKGWVCAKDLKRYDKLYHLTSKIQKNGRVRLYGTNNFEELEEQFIKREYFNASSDMHIHHIDENKANNKIENLKVLSHSEHCKLHGNKRAKAGLINISGIKHFKPVPRYGKNNPHFIDVSVDDLTRMIHQAKGRISKIPMDFDTFKKKCKDLNFDYKKIAAHYQNKYIQLDRESVLNALAECNGVMTKAMKKLNVGYIAFKKFCVENDIEYNHMVQSVTPCGIRHVYDLQVEDFHNFIANEICVHNSSDPNLQNIPAHNKEVRRMFTASNDTILETSEDTLKFFSNDIVPTLRGDIRAVELTVDDVILGEDGKCSVMYIDIDEKLVKTQIKEEKCM